MRKFFLFLLPVFLLLVGQTVWADPTVLFHETFGNNTGSARDWNNSYSVKSGVSAVYSGASYTITNAKQSKNTMGQTASALVSGQAKTGTFIVGPLNVSNYETLTVTNYFGMSAGSWNTTYSFMKLSYSTNNSTYTEVTRTGSNPSSSVSSNSNLVQASYSLPVAAQVSTLYLKFEFYCYQLNKSSQEIGQAYFDEVEIKGTESVDPHLSATPASVSVDADAVASGSISLDYSNFTVASADVNLYDDEDCTVDFTGNWVEASLESPYTTITYSIAANTVTSSRTAYLQVYALDAEADELTVVIPITQAAYVPPTGTFSEYSGSFTDGDYVIYYDGKAMKNTVSSSRLEYESVTPSEGDITDPETSIIWRIVKNGSYHVIYNEAEQSFAASTGADNKAQMLASQGDDKSQWTISGSSAYEFVNKYNTANSKNAYLRNNGTYGFACYAKATGGDLTLYKKQSYTVTLNANTWATFCPVSDVTIPTDDSNMKVYCAKYNSLTSELTISEAECATTIKAGEGVLLRTTTSGTTNHVFNVTTGAGTLGSANDLSGTALPLYLNSSELRGDYTYYVLADNGGIGFYRFEGTVPAGKAYLKLAGAYAGAPSVIRIVDEENNATNIESINATNEAVKFINNGQLLIKRDGITYDMMGRIIK